MFSTRQNAGPEGEACTDLDREGSRGYLGIVLYIERRSVWSG
jgi:hypothetical protein